MLSPRETRRDRGRLAEISVCLQQSRQQFITIRLARWGFSTRSPLTFDGFGRTERKGRGPDRYKTFSTCTIFFLAHLPFNKRRELNNPVSETRPLRLS